MKEGKKESEALGHFLDPMSLHHKNPPKLMRRAHHSVPGPLGHQSGHHGSKAGKVGLAQPSHFATGFVWSYMRPGMWCAYPVPHTTSLHHKNPPKFKQQAHSTLGLGPSDMELYLGNRSGRCTAIPRRNMLCLAMNEVMKVKHLAFTWIQYPCTTHKTTTFIRLQHGAPEILK